MTVAIVTQDTVEVLRDGARQARASQAAVEVLRQIVRDARATQVVVEVLYPHVPRSPWWQWSTQQIIGRGPG